MIRILVLLCSVMTARSAWGTSLVTTGCNFALSRGTGEIEALYPQLAKVSDEDFVRQIAKMFRPKLAFNWPRIFQDGTVRPFVPRRTIKSKPQRYFRTFRQNDALGRTLLKTQPPTPASTPTSPLVDWTEGQRTFSIHRRDKYRRCGMVQVWTEPERYLRSGVVVRTRVFTQRPNGAIKLLDDSSEWKMTEFYFGFVPPI